MATLRFGLTKVYLVCLRLAWDSSFVTCNNAHLNLCRWLKLQRFLSRLSKHLTSCHTHQIAQVFISLRYQFELSSFLLILAAMPSVESEFGA